MCGRYVSTAPPDEIARYFDAQELTEAPIEPSWNVAPTDDIPAVTYRHGHPRGELMRWGLPPSGSGAPPKPPLVNARAETAAERPAFRAAFHARRCLIPAEGFYEWLKAGKDRLPFFFRLTSGEPMALAGLWEPWPAGGGPAGAAVILTCPANEVVAPVHGRMPVIVPPEAYRSWLDPDAGEAAGLLQPFPAHGLSAWQVDRAVSRPDTDGPQLIQPAAQPMERQMGLPL